MDLMAPVYRRVAGGERTEGVQVEWETLVGAAHAGRLGRDDHAARRIGGRRASRSRTSPSSRRSAGARRRSPTRARCSRARWTSTRQPATAREAGGAAPGRLVLRRAAARRRGRSTGSAIEAADPSCSSDAREFDRRYPIDPDAPAGSAQVIRTGEPDLQPEIRDEMLVAVAQDEAHLRLLRALGFRSSMVVPLRAGGRVVGDLAIVSAQSGRRFGEADLAAARELADRCGLYLENARLYRELEAGARRARGDPRGGRGRGDGAGRRAGGSRTSTTPPFGSSACRSASRTGPRCWRRRRRSWPRGTTSSTSTAIPSPSSSCPAGSRSPAWNPSRRSCSTASVRRR